ncbi:type I phosphodiesterase/nucleotide pyrophosphatase [Kockovaella imperatae]|uniref:Type I phosphodiesterase/nucleotide pyrophosphatase n=1 Tax=Kockovaella imperatae TaxID=4999 RepID=A0A1Y1UHJ8_9TREE|nr:type I phosphodiesterase/nucleotide pyrophosphatase [Kockovaella imperatae]ORX37007.1 type I phosphodiesterase/nucleotide pyrophosphatase [Kockovaella imperatae]
MLALHLLLAQPAAARVLPRDIVDPGAPALTYPLTGMSPVGNPPFYSPENVNAAYQHAVYLSIDGMHQSDLEWYVSTFPQSTMASLLQNAIEYTNARCPSPSDSAPGTVSPATGCSPRTHGVYYDDAYDGSLYPPGSNCTGPIGTQTGWDETLDLNNTVLNGGGGFNESMFPLQLTASGYCAAVKPWDFLRVNTMFEVIREQGLVTAYTDKHPAYSMLNGPSGLGLTDGFFPEINAVSGQQETEGYDDLHWSALTNWTMGNYANGTSGLGVPSVYGANFQSVSVSQKAYGYNSELVPTANLTQAFRQVDTRLGQLVDTMKSVGTFDSTLLIIYAKHGQSPINSTLVRKIPHPTLLNVIGVPTVQDASDDASYIWLQDKNDAAQAKANILANATAVGAAEVWIGADIVANGFGNPWFDSRTPDVIIKTEPGVIFTTGKKIAEHGGLNADDHDVVLFVSNPVISASKCDEVVYTRQIAPTFIKALGFDPLLLAGVRAEGTLPLPGVPF